MPHPFPDRRRTLLWVVGVAAALGLVVAAHGLLFRGGSPMTLESLQSLGQEDLVRMAAEALASDGFRRESFDRVTVARSEEDVCVRFEMSVRYVPLDSEAYYSAVRCLVQRLTVRSPLRNPPDRPSQGGTVFFEPSDESRAATSFVTQALAHHPEAGLDAREGIPEGTVVTILEEAHAYAVEVLTATTESRLRVEKGSGMVTELWHADLLPDPEEEDPEG